MKKYQKILLFVSVSILIIIILIPIYHEYYNPETHRDAKMFYYNIYFKPDFENKTITVKLPDNIDFEDFNKWEYIKITSGNATFPEGTVNDGDLITNCSGIVKLEFSSPGGSNRFSGYCDFIKNESTGSFII